MTERRRRNGGAAQQRRPAQQRPQQKSTGTQQRRKPASDAEWMDSGDVGRQTSKKEIASAAAYRKARQEEGYKPQRFFLRKGEEAVVVVLDYDILDMKFFHEHSFWDESQRKFTHDEEFCTRQADCPACIGELTGRDNYPTYMLFLSVLDTRSFTQTGKNGQPDKVIPFTRKLMTVKPTQHDEILNVLQSAKDKYGTTHGVVLKMQRSEADPKSTGLGKPAIVHDGRVFARYSPETMAKKFRHPALKNKEGVVYLEANAMQEPFVYGEIFHKPDANKMRTKFGITPKTDHATHDEVYGESEFDDGGEDDFDDRFNEHQATKVDDNGFSEDDFSDESLDEGYDEFEEQTNQQSRPASKSPQAENSYDDFDDDIPY